MFSAPSLRSLTLIGVTSILLVLYIHAGFPLDRLPSTFSLATSPRFGVGAVDRILPIPSRTYVIHLARRQDRFEDMERLRTRVGLEWSYVPAEDSHSPLVRRIMNEVRSMRQEELLTLGQAYPPNTTIKLPFRWPAPDAPLPFETWRLNTAPPPPPAFVPSDPLTCATEDFTLSPYSPRTPEYKILSPSRIACWHSHLSAIQRASTHMPKEAQTAALILEDDLDIEADVKARLLSVWSLLPADWDIVFLGHCWSNESHYPALGPTNFRFRQNAPAASATLQTQLHPSHRPLCTHAYALSPTGAHRLLNHLSHPPFAYSRAIDHALAWLVQSGRLKSFSVVPSVVAQRKIGQSDVMLGTTGSRWKDGLVSGVLAGEDEAARSSSAEP
ncbi:hypothetical protein B0H16DRAFT_1339939 [Mycena metata]|uniref:Glycosyl transferase family 25 domain-containing protein n=1 Tax=Mycena metata TaxID=1033252 RepID=A0AAD7MFJ8_9AGAR|nr:hypothetical protein B0H16DRAFT_1339939 [Mycena metata]